MSSVSRMLISAPINFISTTDFGMPIGPVPNALGLAFYSPLAGVRSGRVPVIVVSADRATTYRLLGDSNGTWRNASDGIPVSQNIQQQLTADCSA